MDFIIQRQVKAAGFQQICHLGPAKQFRLLSGKLIVLHSLDAIGCWPHCGRIMVVLPEEGVDELSYKSAERSCPFLSGACSVHYRRGNPDGIDLKWSAGSV